MHMLIDSKVSHHIFLNANEKFYNSESTGLCFLDRLVVLAA